MCRWKSVFLRIIVASGAEADGPGSGVAERGVDQFYAATGRRSIAPEYILRALLLQVFYSIRSERQLVEQIDYNLLFRWFVGLGMDDAVWRHAVFSKTAIGY
jgi:transposase